jgi:hypothetical protein
VDPRDEWRGFGRRVEEAARVGIPGGAFPAGYRGACFF